MANKRMFSMRVVNDERFLSLSLAAQALYYALCMHADDDGFMDTAARYTRYVGAEECDLRMLFERGFLLDMGGGVTVIRHWRVHNTIRADRYTPTVFQAELARLTIREDGTYELAEDVSYSVSPTVVPNVSPIRVTSGCRTAAADKERKEKTLSQERGCGGEGTSARSPGYGYEVPEEYPVFRTHFDNRTRGSGPFMPGIAPDQTSRYVSGRRQSPALTKQKQNADTA